MDDPARSDDPTASPGPCTVGQADEPGPPPADGPGVPPDGPEMTAAPTGEMAHRSKEPPGWVAPNTLASGVPRPNTFRPSEVTAPRTPAASGTGSLLRTWRRWSRGPARQATPERRSVAHPVVARPAREAGMRAEAAGYEVATDAFVVRLRQVRPDEAWRLAALWDEADPAARERAHRAVRAAAAAHGRLGLLREVQQAVVRWGAGGFVATEISMPTLGRRVDSGDAQAAAARAALDAGSALAVRDVIDEADFAALYGPWEEALD